MNEIICPNCKKVFKVDQAGFADIVKQVRDHQFEEELENRLALADKEKDSAVELAKAHVKNTLQDEIAKKDKEILELKASSSRDLAEKLAGKELEISEIKSKIQNSETEKKLQISEAVRQIEKERDKLAGDLEAKETEKKLLEKSIEEKFNNQLVVKDETIRMKDEEIGRLKDFKQKLSTKMVGETLEQHCEVEFNKLRATAFRNAHFEKDNDSSGGTKGDYIYRENDDEGNEIVSLMFEMKNENDETATKKKNEDFFAKLDKDRKDKNCEYAILVSLLEPENELYNNGIVDVSHKFGKMYVIRPQFFIPMITLLRNAAMNSLKYKQELSLMKSQNIDITNFEDKITKFREGFAKNYESAAVHFERAIDEIDKSIARMQKVKQELTTSQNQLRLANQKAEGLTIKRLTHGNPTMKEKFKEAKTVD
ncbi:MAG: DUF2130 domain-containing protein [Gammaproteobacteria bacterium]